MERRVENIIHNIRLSEIWRRGILIRGLGDGLATENRKAWKSMLDLHVRTELFHCSDEERMITWRWMGSAIVNFSKRSRFPRFASGLKWRKTTEREGDQIER